MHKNHYIIPIFVSHEGCPHQCVFCNQDSITGSVSPETKASVEKTISDYLKTINRENSIVEVSFYGGTFTGIPLEKQRELLSVAFEYKAKKLIDKIHLSTRPDYIDKSILNHLKDYSVDIIELGVQSMDNEVLVKSGRGHSEEDVVKAVKLIKEFDFTLGIQIMIGLPGDTFQKDIETIKKVIALQPNLCRLYPALTIKNTYMEKMLDMKEYLPYELEETVDVVKTMYSMLLANDINVIRIGLQPTEEINEGADIIAGPFHPAMRELVESKIFNEFILKTLNEIPFNQVVVKVNNKDISKVYANKKKYFNEMISKIKDKKIMVKQDSLVDRMALVFEYGEDCRNVSIIKNIKNWYKEGYFQN
ncbi:elongator complex protein 3 [Clostridium grantii]|uniref:Histone acetyltransferase, component of the RNA polymerase elongator complex n=1 Tax=Clostridium grantii DSM 8605 TaxID=1121316 RepID=A0A1M5QVB0_9CLOT|nr:radical SAM protein [Clostridium grantii]SHH17871.1 Histone acetyltransferase, component of the RNA polymerase elongator complex [Clostridium grantii DSM 8605]